MRPNEKYIDFSQDAYSTNGGNGRSTPANGSNGHYNKNATGSNGIKLTNGKSNGVQPAMTFEREPLPIDSVRRRITEILKNASTAIFIGETGSGKSTQIPQMCLFDACLATMGRMIGVTQPRKVAARALAQRVAAEVGCAVGEKVGYKFRFEDNVSDSTKLAYLTDGILLREALHDCLLSKYSVIIVDEAHERSVHTDVLLYILRLAQQQRANSPAGALKVFLMSATMEGDKFAEYFGNAPVYYIKGRIHPVELYCSDELSIKDDDYLYNAVSTVLQLHRTEPIGHGFLVFLTGQEEIDSACKMIEKSCKELNQKIVAIPLYSSVSPTIQAKCFAPLPSGIRKVIFATNIAETSLTIPGIRIVIDSGKVKQKSFTSTTRVDVLRVVNISKAQAIQRAGRAGREARGKCYRLYAQADCDAFVESQPPEILRTNLSSVLLDLAKMGMRRTRHLKLIDQPATELVDAAVRELLMLKAVELDKKERLCVTSTGAELVKFPVDPAHAKILLSASLLNCLEEALTVVAFLASETVFTSTASVENVTASTSSAAAECSDRRAIFDANEGDHVRMLKIYRSFRTQLKNNKNSLKEWCVTNGLHLGRLENVARIRKQLAEICNDSHYVMGSCGADFTPLRKAICKGLFLNACVYDRAAAAYRLERRSGVTVKIHPSSCLARANVSAFVFTELVETTETYARDICLIDAEWLAQEAHGGSGASGGAGDATSAVSSSKLSLSSSTSSNGRSYFSQRKNESYA